MKVLLTGGNGFIGSHILDFLLKEQHSVNVLLRETSDTQFIENHLHDIRTCYGSLTHTHELQKAVADVDCIVHCAGKTKANDRREYFRVNRDGTSNLIHAANETANPSCHFIHISSRAVLSPSTREDPVGEDYTPDPISDYGKSKLEAEHAVMGECKVPWTILRPAAVYGPRDTDFYSAFRAIKWHILPLFDGGNQPLNLVYGPDVARAVLSCMGNPQSEHEAYNVASPNICDVKDFMRQIASTMDKWTLPLYLPGAMLYPVCLAHELGGKITGNPSILNRQKYGELTAPGWTCSVAKMQEDLDFTCPTDIEEGVCQTLNWYEEKNWL